MYFFFTFPKCKYSRKFAYKTNKHNPWYYAISQVMNLIRDAERWYNVEQKTLELIMYALKAINITIGS